MAAENITDLGRLISLLSDDDFSYHIAGGNHFANWVRDILHQEDLANEMRKAVSKQDLLDTLKDNIEEENEQSFMGDFKRLLARDFIYGLVLGLIIGIIIHLLLS